ncbi:uncharacterized protein LOC133716212 [Rosa rugosa]|uniref:uncharacterized protein LOC133716212 n=1 Tax=Rosa rugosa TaxID=74645 RepID=UPI002B400DA9|nr:uncharacterized protein LOC133716212 [Rosa rugosa]
MDNLLFWNARGAGGDDFRSAISDLVKMNNVDFLIICEPRVQFIKAKKHLLGLGFNEFEIKEANGFSGGIWMVWNNSKFKVEVIDSNSQSITVKISWCGLRSWMLTGIYASPCITTRQGLWHYLTHIHTAYQLPWVVVGDCNELLSFSDKNGGSYIGKFGGMKTWVQQDGMIDLGYHGADYTWSGGTVKERLDRGFCNSDWRLLFPEAKVQHLAKMKSDHCPLLLRLQNQFRSCRVDPPFRFYAMWMQHSHYSEFIANTWNETTGEFMSKIKHLAMNLGKWNREVFGNIFHQKKRLLARICGIQKQRCTNDNPFLIDLEKKLILEYEDIKDREALLWRQKSREKWVQGGDRNTKFFHITTMVRRRKK